MWLKPGAALQTPFSLINELNDSLTHPLVKIFLRRSHAQMVQNCAS